jgi:hypothetical protein
MKENFLLTLISVLLLPTISFVAVNWLDLKTLRLQLTLLLERFDKRRIVLISLGERLSRLENHCAKSGFDKGTDSGIFD